MSHSNFFIDTHVHLDYEYPVSISELLTEARQEGIRGFISIGAESSRWEIVQSLAELTPDVFFALGIHPHDASLWTFDLGKKIEQASTSEKCLAVGEIGLDFYYNHSPVNDQLKAFDDQINLAIQLKKPISIHSRNADEETLRHLSCYKGKINGVIHCFSGSEDFARGALELGFFISFSGILTFKNSQPLRDIASWIPIDRLLIETDAPYLAPIPFRGKKNRPLYLLETAKELAHIRNHSLQDLSSILFQNTETCFNMGSKLKKLL